MRPTRTIPTRTAFQIIRDLDFAISKRGGDNPEVVISCNSNDDADLVLNWLESTIASYHKALDKGCRK